MRSRLMLVPFAALLACGGGYDSSGPGTGGGGSTPAPTTAAVNMTANQFSPKSVRIAKGGIVTWTNSDGYAHDVTFDGNPGVANIPAFLTGSQSATMPAAATSIAYHCTIHGAAMSGTIKVE